MGRVFGIVMRRPSPGNHCSSYTPGAWYETALCRPGARISWNFWMAFRFSACWILEFLNVGEGHCFKNHQASFCKKSPPAAGIFLLQPQRMRMPSKTWFAKASTWNILSFIYLPFVCWKPNAQQLWLFKCWYVSLGLFSSFNWKQAEPKCPFYNEPQNNEQEYTWLNSHTVRCYSCD